MDHLGVSVYTCVPMCMSGESGAGPGAPRLGTAGACCRLRLEVGRGGWTGVRGALTQRAVRHPHEGVSEQLEVEEEAALEA